MTPAASRPAVSTCLAPRVAALVVLCLGGLSAPAGGGQPAAEPSDATAFQAEIARAWTSRDLALWMSLWDLPDAAQRAAEEATAGRAFASDHTSFEWFGPPRLAADGIRLTADGQVFTAVEPQANVSYVRLSAVKRAGRWLLVSRSEEGSVDGLVHLSLGPRAWKARNASLRLEDFELRMEAGTLFSSPDSLGPTLLVFVGKGRVRMAPRPPAEREQLRLFAGTAALDTPVSWSYVRIDPASFPRVIEAAGLEPDPLPPVERVQEAQRILSARSPHSFMLDASIPRSPWWLVPPFDDAVVDFPWRRNRVLTFAISRREAEDVNLFDRDKGIQICAYRSAQRAGELELGPSTIDILDQSMEVRFEPARFTLSAVHTMRFLARGNASLRLRLDDDFSVSSVSTGEGRGLLFFRVHGQGTLVVLLGTLADSEEPLTLVTRYAGRHDPAPIDQELLQFLSPPEDDIGPMLVGRRPLVYANATAWYPRPRQEDFSPSHLSLETPEGWLAVTGGNLASLTSEAGRTRTEFQLSEPGKFVTVIVGEFPHLDASLEGGQALRGFATARQQSQIGELLSLAQQILSFYAESFGPCPYPWLSLVLAEAYADGGHSPPGLVYLQRRPLLLRGRQVDDPASFREFPDFFLAHELAHQWWGQGVAPASYRDRWLSEAWAQYAAALWIQKRHGEDAFRSVMDRMAVWARRYDQAGPIDLGHRLGTIEGDPQTVRAVVYDKGAWVVHALRGIVGEQAFFGGVRAFLEKHRFAKVRTDDLRQALEAASGRDLRPYFDRWILDTGLPEVDWAADSTAVARGFRTVVELRPRKAPGSLPVEISLWTAAGVKTQRVLVDPSGASYVFETPDRPRRVALNEDRGLLASFERVRRLPERAP